MNSSTNVAAPPPAGLAAFNVQGLTIHRLLKLPVEHGLTPEYKPLSDTVLRQLRNELKDVKLIIIDEISMVSNVILLFMHLRLQDIYNSFQMEDGWFGGVNILFFGDLLQSPPVTRDGALIRICPFDTLTAYKLETIHSSIVVDTNLWADLFSYDELTINVRQQSDKVYADLMSRIRVSQVDDNDVEELQSRQITFTPNQNQEVYLQELVKTFQALPAGCICLLPTNNQCHQLNSVMLSLLTGEEVVLEAIETIDSRKNVQRQKALDYLKTLSEDSSRTAGLEEIITIKVGCKVMLCRNIDSKLGLVNGAIGTILDIVRNRDALDDTVSKTKIRFSKVDHLLERIDVKFEVFSNVYAVRSQFPIILAYAITIHKSQSLSLECCLMDIGEFVFAAGQTYVALSRVTTFNGVYLINWCPTAVKANEAAIHEYNRLRHLYRPDLSKILITINSSPFYRDIPWSKKKLIARDPTGDEDRRDAPLVCLPGF